MPSPPPPPSPRPSPSPLIISAEINAATRQIHTSLNRLITSRLPLGLPPHTDSPDLYAFGLRHFAHVYLTFEAAWRDVCAASPESSLPPEDTGIAAHDPISPSSVTSSAPPADPDHRALEFIARLLPPGLSRSRRLRNDLARLYNISAAELDVQLSQHPGQTVREYATHIRQAVARKPWVLVAYAWVMYMAVFSGGRWIRAQLVEAGEAFWSAPGKPDSAGVRECEAATMGEAAGVLEQRKWEELGISFFHFDGDEDGEDIKADFKRRLGEAEALLTVEQRQDVVEEAKEIFRRSVLLVEELDELAATPPSLTKIGSLAERTFNAVPARKDETTVLSRLVLTARTRWFNAPKVAGLAVVLSCASWYALSHAGMWG